MRSVPTLLPRQYLHIKSLTSHYLKLEFSVSNLRYLFVSILQVGNIWMCASDLQFYSFNVWVKILVYIMSINYIDHHYFLWSLTDHPRYVITILQGEKQQAEIMFVSLFFIIFYINYLVWAAASMFICFDEHLLQINIAVFVHRTNLLVSTCCYKNVLLFAGLLQPLNPVREFSPRSFTCPTRSIARV